MSPESLTIETPAAADPGERKRLCEACGLQAQGQARTKRAGGSRVE